MASFIPKEIIDELPELDEPTEAALQQSQVHLAKKLSTRQNPLTRDQISRPVHPAGTLKENQSTQDISDNPFVNTVVKQALASQSIPYAAIQLPPKMIPQYQQNVAKKKPLAAIQVSEIAKKIAMDAAQKGGPGVDTAAVQQKMEQLAQMAAAIAQTASETTAEGSEQQQQQQQQQQQLLDAIQAMVGQSGSAEANDMLKNLMEMTTIISQPEPVQQEIPISVITSQNADDMLNSLISSTITEERQQADSQPTQRLNLPQLESTDFGDIARKPSESQSTFGIDSSTASLNAQRQRTGSKFQKPTTRHVDAKDLDPSKGGFFGTPLPGTKPSTRKDALALQMALADLVQRLPREEEPKPTLAKDANLELFSKIIQEEQAIYDQVFGDMIKQIMSHTQERGEVLKEIRTRYAKLFQKIPDHFQNLYYQSAAHRKILKRMQEELIQTEIKLENITKSMNDIKEQTQTLIEVEQVVTSETVAQTAAKVHAESYRTLYKLQRERMEEQTRQADTDRRRWQKMAVKFALRYATEHGWPYFHNIAHATEKRYLMANDIMFALIDKKTDDCKRVEQAFEAWKEDWIKVNEWAMSREIWRADIVGKIWDGTKKALKIVESEAIKEEILDGKNPMLSSISSKDREILVEMFQKWFTDLGKYMSQNATENMKHAILSDDLESLKSRWTALFDSLYSILNDVRNWGDGRDYQPMIQKLQEYNAEQSIWQDQVAPRIFGEQHLTVFLENLYGQIEIHREFLRAGEGGRPMDDIDIRSITEVLSNWETSLVQQSSRLKGKLRENASDWPEKINSCYENLSKQVQLDYNAFLEDCNRVCDGMLDWLVAFAEKMSGEHITKLFDFEFQKILQDLTASNIVIEKMSKGNDVKSQNGESCIKQINESSEMWQQNCRDLIVWSKMQDPVTNPKRPPPLFSQKKMEIAKDALQEIPIEFELVPEEVQIMQFIREKTTYLKDLINQTP